MAIASGTGGNSLLDSIQKSLGVNQIAFGTLNAAAPNSSINTTSPELQNNTAVFIGKTISPRLYVRYGIGLFNNQQELDTSLQLTRHWSLKTNAGTQAQGADLVFTIDK
jgi:autotransporter translocation and assembly factor TamB